MACSKTSMYITGLSYILEPLVSILILFVSSQLIHNFDVFELPQLKDIRNGSLMLILLALTSSCLILKRSAWTDICKQLILYLEAHECTHLRHLSPPATSFLFVFVTSAYQFKYTSLYLCSLVFSSKSPGHGSQEACNHQQTPVNFGIPP